MKIPAGAVCTVLTTPPSLVRPLSMLARRICTLAVAAVTLCLAQYAAAATITSDNYEIYYGDLNNDGISDYYFSGKPRFVILNGDILTPIAISLPKNYVIYRTGNVYSDPQYFSLSPSDIAQKVATGSLRLAVANTDFYLWTNEVSGLQSVLLRGANVTAPSLLLSTAPTQDLPLLMQVYAVNNAANLSDRNQAITLQDKNADGKTDIVMGNYVYTADSSGIPAPYAAPLSPSAAATQAYEYDALGRLIKVTANNALKTTYNYDKAGNRTSVTEQ